MQSSKFEQRVANLLPELLAQLLEAEVQTQPNPSPSDRRSDPDLLLEAAGRRWVVEAKQSGGPGPVDAAALQLKDYVARVRDGVPLLVVSYMSDAGRAAADARGLNWIDLSGNAHIRDGSLFIRVEGRPNRYPKKGRPSSPFASKSARVSRVLLGDPLRWWRQRDLVEVTDLDDGHMSRVIRKLDDEDLLEFDDSSFRPRDPSILLDAWAEEYRFDRHETTMAHSTGSGVELVRKLDQLLADSGVRYAFTGLPAAWLYDHFAQFRLCSVYVDGPAEKAVERLGLRVNERGANIQLIRPDDQGVYYRQELLDDIPCVSPVQTYLDLRHLPERANEAAAELRSTRLDWSTSV